MKLADAMQALSDAGKPNTVKIYRRHGVRNETFGVSYGALNTLAKRIKKDHPDSRLPLALALWDTGHHDARVLAAKIVPAKAVKRATLETWSAEVGNYVENGALVEKAAKTPYALELARAWIERKGDFPVAAGWSIYTSLIMKGKVRVEEAATLLERIGETLHQGENRTRYSMNNTLIAIGGQMADLRARAKAIAVALGPVEVDHGKTGCQTPEAVSYIDRMVAHETAKAARKARRKGG